MSLKLKTWLIPALIVLFGLISIVTLKSVAAQFATQQLIFFIAGLCTFGLITRFSYPFLSRFRWSGYIAIVALLILTLIIGVATRNTRRWINFGGVFSIQGSQFAAPMVGMTVAHFLAKRQEHEEQLSLKSLFQLLILMGIPAALILVAPDLGSTIFYLASLGVVFLLGPVPWRILGLVIGLAVIASVVAWNFILQDYQKDRIYCFAAPQLRPSCSVYNAEQSLIAVGSGQVFGRGLGQGIQSHLKFLPERQTDFIFASFAEEWGFLGSVLMIAMYAVLVGYIIKIGLSASHPAHYYYCMMMATLIALQSAYHIGMNMYLFPIKGISLPLVSYGGSSMLGMVSGLAVVQTIANIQQEKLGQHFG